MKLYTSVIIASIASFFCAVIGVLSATVYYTSPAPSSITPPAVQEDTREWLKWDCTVALDCPRVDWRYSRPVDVCTYQKQIIMSPTNPVELAAYGGECTQL